ncbi:MAG: DUF368 domain-containing protein [Coprobacillus sp.]|nr:DUF368 domain-containing protein [Coprobacillus sp.]
MKENKVGNFFRRLVSGLLIGITDTIPGISGGTTAVIAGVYDDLVFAISKIGRQFKKSIVIIVPVILGMIIGIVPCIFLFDLAFDWFAFGTVCIFGGLMIGTFPSIIDHVKGEKCTKPCIILLIVGIVVALGLGILSISFNLTDTVESIFIDRHWWFYIVVAAIGFVLAFFTVVPGISGSMILLVLGCYTNLNKYFSLWTTEMFNGNFANTGALWGLIVTFIIGIALGAYAAAKVMAFLLSRWRVAIYYLIIGFVAGSIAVIFYTNDIYQYYMMWASGGQGAIPMLDEIRMGIVLFLASIAIGYYIIVWYRKTNAKKEEQKLEAESEVEKTVPTKEGGG